MTVDPLRSAANMEIPMNHRRNVFILLLVATLLVGNVWQVNSFALASNLSSATREPPLLPTGAPQIDLNPSVSASSDGPTGPVVARLYIRDRDHLNAVAGALDIWEVHHDLGYAVVAVSPYQYQWLQSLGYQLTW